ncbi:hypothetical protein L211DRAFT_848395 [Terfezia boudieri ATCC MYA-4762]|uniref:Uncharacterized protein n=1 Tax=Terfezia boudieri ATCC MYA-4762 TaxID=1051890 RepID=A0A3N4LQ59_9PEZI|nr:hypothetical protein L211DRAFT_848395 [Terfezia boudieri ATCC MYA-4762]
MTVVNPVNPSSHDARHSDFLEDYTIVYRNWLTVTYVTVYRLGLGTCKSFMYYSRRTKGWTPLASAAFLNKEGLCQFLVEKGCTLTLNAEQKEQLKPNLLCGIHGAAAGGYKTALQLLLDMEADIIAEGCL